MGMSLFATPVLVLHQHLRMSSVTNCSLCEGTLTRRIMDSQSFVSHLWLRTDRHLNEARLRKHAFSLYIVEEKRQLGVVSVLKMHFHFLFFFLSAI